MLNRRKLNNKNSSRSCWNYYLYGWRR